MMNLIGTNMIDHTDAPKQQSVPLRRFEVYLQGVSYHVDVFATVVVKETALILAFYRHGKQVAHFGNALGYQDMGTVSTVR